MWGIRQSDGWTHKGRFEAMRLGVYETERLGSNQVTRRPENISLVSANNAVVKTANVQINMNEPRISYFANYEFYFILINKIQVNFID